MRKPILYQFYLIVAILLCSCEQEVDLARLPVVSTTVVSSVTYYSAQSGGVITADGGYDVIARGVCWSTSPNPDIKDSKTVDAAGTGTFESSIENLLPGTTYYLRAYATNKKGTSYGLQETFTTMALSLSEITTSPVTSITTTSAVTGGAISIDGGTSITARGVCWSTSSNPTINDSITVDGVGAGNFISTLSGLKTGTTYYVKAYSTNSKGTSYGDEVQFKTLSSIPEVITATINSITTSSAISGGEILHDGGETVIARGVCWGTSPIPTTNNSKTITGSGKGSFSSILSNLKSGTQYYIRAYATNSIGTAYGNELTFSSSISLPELTTIEISDLSSSMAKSGGIITHDGGAEITSRGVCWSITPNPTINDNVTVDGAGTGNFFSTLSNLIAGTKYYLRAYASNSVGVSYGNEIKFYIINPGEVYNPITERIWMDRNLGAGRVAISSTDDLAYGDLYQWGRNSDGHEKRTSLTTTIESISDTPAHGNFIIVKSGNLDWRSPQNNYLWSKIYKINNPCPEGFRIPTADEWEAERTSWISNNAIGAYDSPLKLPLAGYRFYGTGSLFSFGTYGYYWSSTVHGTYAKHLYFYSGDAFINTLSRSYGFCVRCIKD
jgi:uncharacterized protein (TIGR02145 family)